MSRFPRTPAIAAMMALVVAGAPLATLDAQGGGATTGAQMTENQQAQDDDGFDPGWFGLLGLLGLLGLRRRDEPRRDYDTTTRRP